MVFVTMLDTLWESS